MPITITVLAELYKNYVCILYYLICINRLILILDSSTYSDYLIIFKSNLITVLYIIFCYLYKYVFGYYL